MNETRKVPYSICLENPAFVRMREVIQLVVKATSELIGSSF